MAPNPTPDPLDTKTVPLSHQGDLIPAGTPNESLVTGQQELPVQLDKASMIKQFCLMKKAFRQWKLRQKKGAATIVTRYTRKGRPVY